MIERRREFVIDQEKFSTQRVVTYFLLFLFACVTAAVFYANDQAERSTILQTIINFTMLAIGFWLGSSKGAADNTNQLNKIMAQTAPMMQPDTISTPEVTVESQNTTVNTPKDAPKKV